MVDILARGEIEGKGDTQDEQRRTQRKGAGEEQKQSVHKPRSQTFALGDGSRRRVGTVCKRLSHGAIRQSLSLCYAALQGRGMMPHVSGASVCLLRRQTQRAPK